MFEQNEWGGEANSIAKARMRLLLSFEVLNGDSAMELERRPTFEIPACCGASETTQNHFFALVIADERERRQDSDLFTCKGAFQAPLPTTWPP